MKALLQTKAGDVCPWCKGTHRRTKYQWEHPDKPRGERGKLVQSGFEPCENCDEQGRVLPGLRIMVDGPGGGGMVST